MAELITGANGQLGQALQEQFPKAIALDHDKLDITNYESLKNFNWQDIKTIINAAAYTKVDEAETPEGMVAAWQTNATGVANLATIASEQKLTLVHISTDYVYDGSKKSPYQETDPINPLNNYGRSKAAGDLAAASVLNYYIIRTSWVIGEGSNFVRTMLRLAQNNVSPSVVSDQIGRPSFTLDLARAIDHLLKTAPEPGIYNVSNSGEPVSWADLARAVFEVAGVDPSRVSNVTTAEYFAGKTNIAPRPLNSVLSLDKIESSGFTPRDWRKALIEYLEKEINS